MPKNPMLDKLIILRKNHGLTITSMAQKLNISKSMYGYIEKGKKRLSYDIAVAISEIFKMTPDELFYEDFEKFFANENI